MPLVSIVKVGCYTYPEKFVQTSHAVFLELMVGGFSYHRTTWPGGWEVEWNKPGPRLAIYVPGCVWDFECGRGRENWAVQLQTRGVRYDQATREIRIREGGEWFACPASVEVSPDRVPYWRKQFERLKQAWESNTPHDRLWAWLTVGEIFRFMIEQPPPVPAPYPVAQLKKLLEEDVNHDRAIDELYAACDYSSSRLRELFRQIYRISPRAYRNQCRMAKVMDLAIGSSMSIKEMVRATGFKHLSHLSAAFHRSHGKTLSEVIRLYRRG